MLGPPGLNFGNLEVGVTTVDIVNLEEAWFWEGLRTAVVYEEGASYTIATAYRYSGRAELLLRRRTGLRARVKGSKSLVMEPKPGKLGIPIKHARETKPCVGKGRQLRQGRQRGVILPGRGKQHKPVKGSSLVCKYEQYLVQRRDTGFKLRFQERKSKRYVNKDDKGREGGDNLHTERQEFRRRNPKGRRLTASASLHVEHVTDLLNYISDSRKWRRAVAPSTRD
ncbi:hypothetical protein FPV67DRAFT_1445594 [Lyophyllum atratum]|nr:hypothetical protein FPV67DRAFT_1445594 [Lyophyllum atratum]